MQSQSNLAEVFDRLATLGRVVRLAREKRTGLEGPAAKQSPLKAGQTQNGIGDPAVPENFITAGDSRQA